MYLLAAISKADEMRPNTISQLRKAEILMTLEAKIAEAMEEETPDLNYMTDRETGEITITDMELLMPDPQSECYPFFLSAQIDNINQDSELYENDRKIADDYIANALAWYRRDNRPSVWSKWKGL